MRFLITEIGCFPYNVVTEHNGLWAKTTDVVTAVVGARLSEFWLFVRLEACFLELR